MEDRIPGTPPVIEPLEDGIVRPLWSVMIPTYNCIHYIKSAINSVLAQDLGQEQMQIEVIDDFSTDGDVEALVQEVGKGRVAFYKQPKNRGSLRNFETCIRRSRGHYVHILHGDDLTMPGFYQQIGDLFNSFPEAGAAFSNFNFIDHTGKVLDIPNASLLEEKGIVPDFVTKIAARQLVQPPAIAVKRSTYEKVGSFYAVHFGEDWEMWTRIASQFPMAYSPDYLACYRVAHGIGISHNSVLTGQNLKDVATVIDIIQGYLPEDKRRPLRRAAALYNAIYSIKIANGMLVNNRKGALMQVRGALKLSKTPTTLFWATRFYLMYLSRFKEYYGRIKKIQN